MVNYYSSIPVLKWLFDEVGFPFPGEFDSLLMTSGDGPYKKKDFDGFLTWLNFSVFSLDISKDFASAEILIIGQEGWNKDDIRDLIDKRRGHTLRVYSQEMFLAYLLVGADPLTSKDRDWIISLGEGHSALEFLQSFGSIWPSTDVSGGGGVEIDDSNWPQVGVLSKMGYKVGKDGIYDQNMRHQVLNMIYLKEQGALPRVMSKSYLDEWGLAGSCKRLEKMANSIATFCRNAKRKDNDMTVAIKHWEEDLKWLKQKYIDSHCVFQWPSTVV